ncbi:MAG: hypothetical protein C0436_00080 [Alphaproteobacteria bacterium]|nr:hypothetical protein [Alphaproteobacteria bacterium]
MPDLELNRGLVGAWGGAIPEYPTDPAGTTYFQDAWATVDGWNAVGGGAVSVASGRLRHTSASVGNEFIHRVFTPSYDPSGRSIKAKVRLVAGTMSSITIIGAGYHSLGVSIIPTTSWQIFDINPTNNWSAVQDVLVFDFEGQSADCIIEFDFIYIGTGAYNANSLLDLSGNGNHGTVLGATPVPGISGRALSFDGVNDYVVSSAPIAMPDVLHYHEIWEMPSDGNMRFIFGVGASSFPRLFLFRGAGSNTLVIGYFNGSNIDINIANFFSASTEKITADISVNWLTGAYTVYKNGVLFSSGTMVSPQKPASQLWYWRNGAALFANQFAFGVYDDPRIYNRALSAAEIAELYNKPGGYNLDEVARSTASVPNSIGVRDSLGDFTARQLKSTVATGTAPLSITSTTKVNNLNVDRIDDLDSTDFARTTGTVAQTLTGVKTFGSIPVLPGSDPTLANQAARKAYIDGKVPGKITISTLAPTGGVDGDIWITV